MEELYKGRLTENARLNKAARLLAKQHALLTSYMAPNVKYSTKAVRRPFLPGGSGGGGRDGGDDGAGDHHADDDITQGPLQNILT